MFSIPYQTQDPQFKPTQQQKNYGHEFRNNEMASAWNEYVPIKYNFLEMKPKNKYTFNNDFEFHDKTPVYRQEISYMPVPRFQNSNGIQEEILCNQIQYDFQTKREDIQMPQHLKKEQIPYTKMKTLNEDTRKAALHDTVKQAYNDSKVARNNENAPPPKRPSLSPMQLAMADLYAQGYDVRLNTADEKYFQRTQNIRQSPKQQEPIAHQGNQISQVQTTPNASQQFQGAAIPQTQVVSTNYYEYPQEYPISYGQQEIIYPERMVEPIYPIDERTVDRKFVLDQYIQESNVMKMRIDDLRQSNKERSEQLLYHQSRAPEMIRQISRPFHEVQGRATNSFYASPNMYKYSY